MVMYTPSPACAAAEAQRTKRPIRDIGARRTNPGALYPNDRLVQRPRFLHPGVGELLLSSASHLLDDVRVERLHDGWRRARGLVAGQRFVEDLQSSVDVARFEVQPAHLPVDLGEIVAQLCRALVRRGRRLGVL